MRLQLSKGVSDVLTVFGREVCHPSPTRERLGPDSHAESGKRSQHQPLHTPSCSLTLTHEQHVGVAPVLIAYRDTVQSIIQPYRMPSCGHLSGRLVIATPYTISLSLLNWILWRVK